ncbi:MAG: BLUF domain-containing protein, partial [Verrucomicrobiota bacterium]
FASTMHLIVYISQYTGPAENIDEVLSSIVEKAKTRNPERDITGVLFYHNGTFLQIIEGPHASLEDLMSKLKEDSRHNKIERIIDEDISGRSFKEWNMDSFNLSETDKIDPDELRKIKNAYKRSFFIKADYLAEFYKLMLSTHELKEDESV